MVLLKNDGLLPLKPGIKKIAVVGPLADQTTAADRQLCRHPTHIVSIMDGLHAEFPQRHDHLCSGYPVPARLRVNPVPDSLLTTPDGKPGLKAEYDEVMRRGLRLRNRNRPLVSRTETNVKLSASNLPAEVAGKKSYGVQWTGFLTPTDSGDYLIGIRADGFGRLRLMASRWQCCGRGTGVGLRAWAASIWKRDTRSHSALTTATMNGNPQARTDLGEGERCAFT